jgi:uncharacterized protein YprB with RNaseH-like and TPR domain
MEHALRKRLEILKSRAREIRRLYLARHGVAAPGEPGSPVTLAEAAPGEQIAAGSSSLYLIRTAAEDVVPEFAALAAAFAGDTCFFDIETTGLSPSTYVFLCGMMYAREGRFAIEQAFARDYSEEAAMLGYTRDLLARFRTVVTYNGASFDLPFVRARMAVARIDYKDPRDHVDLLFPARQRYKGVLADCRLETIERHMRGVSREGDIPGSEIPDAYHEFVRTGDARKIVRILHHNRMDLLAMVGLFNGLVTRQAP